MQAYQEIRQLLTDTASEADRRLLRTVCERAARIIGALEKREHPESDVGEYLERFRSTIEADPRPAAVSRVSNALLTHLEKNHGLVVPGHYRDQWTGVGIAAFGVPLGVAFGTAMDNMAFIGIGIPLGLAIGSSIGAKKDSEAAREDRQLEMDAE